MFWCFLPRRCHRLRSRPCSSGLTPSMPYSRTAAARYTSKVLSTNAWHGPKNLGPVSPGPILGALGLKLA
jgi:hypothetical protein